MHRALHWSASLLLTVLASSVCLTHALPSILSPNASSVWTAASVQSVVWDIGEPDISPNAHGRVVLGYIDPIADEGGFYEYDDQPLSDDLLVSEGIIDVVVPTALPSGRYYYCVLIVGDARTRSEVFSIDNPVNPSTSTAKVVFPSTLSVGKAPPKNSTKGGRRIRPEFVAGLAFGSLMFCYVRPLSRLIIRVLTGEEPTRTLPATTSDQDTDQSTMLLDKANKSRD